MMESKSVDKKVTIVVPVYKIREEYLRYCLESILRQSDPRWNAILVDDGSPDNCGSICDEYSGKDPRFTVIHQENMGVSVARNAGISSAKTEWITFVDPDDWVEPELVKQIVQTCSTNTIDVLMYGYTREFKSKALEESLQEDGYIPKELLQCVRIAPLERLIVENKVVKYTVNAIWNKAYRRDYINQNGFRFEPDAKKGQDRVFNLYVLDKTDRVYYLDRSLYHYRNDNESSIVNRYNTKAVQNSRATIALMKSWIEKNNKSEIYTDRLNCWICSRIQEYMKLYYFNKQNDMKYREASKQLTKLLRGEPYCTALANVNRKMLTFEEKVFVFFAQRHMYSVCLLLMRMRDRYRKRKK